MRRFVLEPRNLELDEVSLSLGQRAWCENSMPTTSVVVGRSYSKDLINSYAMIVAIFG